jgi:hypothetical protein
MTSGPRHFTWNLQEQRHLTSMRTASEVDGEEIGGSPVVPLPPRFATPDVPWVKTQQLEAELGDIESRMHDLGAEKARVKRESEEDNAAWREKYGVLKDLFVARGHEPAAVKSQVSPLGYHLLYTKTNCGT